MGFVHIFQYPTYGIRSHISVSHVWDSFTYFSISRMGFRSHISVSHVWDSFTYFSISRMGFVHIFQYLTYGIRSHISVSSRIGFVHIFQYLTYGICSHNYFSISQVRLCCLRVKNKLQYFTNGIPVNLTDGIHIYFSILKMGFVCFQSVHDILNLLVKNK